MKKLFSIMAVAAMIFAGSLSVNAATAKTGSQALAAAATVSFVQEETAPAQPDKGFHQELKERFVEGGPGFMGVVLLC